MRIGEHKYAIQRGNNMSNAIAVRQLVSMVKTIYLSI